MTYRRECVALAAILAVAAILRIAAADFGLWFDEVASLAFAHQPLAHLWSGWMVRESNPPLYYTMLKGWMALAGDSDRAVRLLSVPIGLIGVFCAWGFARRLGGAWAGLAAAALVALSAPHVEYSLEVRSMALTYAAALAGLWALVAWLDTRRNAALACYAGAAVVAFYAHTMMAVFVALTAAVAGWTVRNDRRMRTRLLAAMAIVGIASAWWGMISFLQVTAPYRNFGWIPRPTLKMAWLTVQFAYVRDVGMLTAVLCCLQIAACCWLAWRERTSRAALPAVIVVGAPAVLLAISLVTPVLLPRTMMWAGGPLLVGTAVALRPVAWRTPVLVGVLLIETLLVARWWPEREKEAWRETMPAIARAIPGATVLVEGDAPALAALRYATGQRIVVLTPGPDVGDRWAEGLASAPRVDAAAVRGLLARGPVVALSRGPSDPAARLSATVVARPWPGSGDGPTPHVSLLEPRSPR